MRRKKQRGTTMIEFSLILLAMLTVLFGTIEIGRLAMNYTTIADAARAATRYAVVHGADRIGTGADGPSGPADYSQVTAVIDGYITTASMNSANLSINPSYNPYLDGNNNIGSRVKIQLVYSYTPMLLLSPMNLLTLTLSTTSEGYICY